MWLFSPVRLNGLWLRWFWNSINNGWHERYLGRSSEGNGNGYYIAVGGNNIAHAVDFEATNQDVTFASNNYNGLEKCTYQKTPQLGGLFSTNWKT